MQRTRSKEIEDFPKVFHGFVTQVKEQHQRSLAEGAASGEAGGANVAPALAQLRNLNLNASLGTAPEREPLPSELFHRENSTTL